MIAQVERYPRNDDEVFVSDLNLMSGGAAANTACACAKLGLSTAFIGMIGKNDIFAEKIINDFHAMKVSTHYLKYNKDYVTGSAFIALNKEGERRIFAHSGAANYLSKEEILIEEIENTKVLFLSNLKNLEPFIKAAEFAKRKGIYVILNPGMLIINQGFENVKELFGLIDILILSKNEFMTLYNLDILDFKANTVNKKFKSLFSLGIKILIITLGKEGAYLINQTSKILIKSYQVNKVVDTTGAGDAFSAGFIFSFLNNLSFNFNHLIPNVRIGNFVASKCIQELGARNGIPNLEEVKNFINNIQL